MNEFHEKRSRQAMEALSKQPPVSENEFIEQCKRNAKWQGATEGTEPTGEETFGEQRDGNDLQSESPPASTEGGKPIIQIASPVGLVDPELWADIKPILDEMWEAAKKGGMEPKVYARLVRAKLGREGRPYFRRWAREMLVNCEMTKPLNYLGEAWLANFEETNAQEFRRLQNLGKLMGLALRNQKRMARRIHEVACDLMDNGEDPATAHMRAQEIVFGELTS